MLDIIAAISLAVLSVLVWGTLIEARGGSAATRIKTAAVVAAWFVILVSLGALGVFSATGGSRIAAIAAAVLAPIALAIVAAATSPAVRWAALGIPPATLVAIHAGRLLGVFFLLLLAAGRLPPTFAHSAGWGDVLVGLTAGPLAWMIQRRRAGWRRAALVWNTLGALDLVAAVTLGIGSAPDSPLRFIFEPGSTVTLGTLPWLLVPGFLVPLYFTTHVALFARLARVETQRPSRAPIPSPDSVSPALDPARGGA